MPNLDGPGVLVRLRQAAIKVPAGYRHCLAASLAHILASVRSEASLHNA